MLFDERQPVFVLPSLGRCSIFILAAWLSTLSSDLAAADSNKYDLKPSMAPGRIERVRMLLEVTGQLKISGADKKEMRIPLQVNGELIYDERLLESDTQNKCRKTVRHYDTAQADLKIGDTTQKPTLHADRRLAVTQVTASESVLFSPLAPFTRDELELLEVQANSAVLDRLLPESPVAVGDRWDHDNSTIAAILCMDAITQHDVRSTLREIENSVAIIDMAGNVNGAVRGISSDIQLRGKYNFDLKQRMITWIAISITESRASSAAEPGFEVVARLRQVIAPAEPRPELSDESLKGLSLESSPGSMLLTLASAAGRFQLLHARQWRVMMDRNDLTVLRLIEQGDLITQCNASRLIDLPAGQRVSMESFQADIQRALGEHFGEFREVTQEGSDGGLRVLRAVVSGTTSELPIQWTYYHLSDDLGHQAAIVFTTDARLIEKFADADRAIISSFQFLDTDPAPPSPPRAEATTAAQNRPTTSSPPRR